VIAAAVENFSNAAVKKAGMMNSSVARYFVLSMMAGIYVGFGIMLVFSIGAPLKSSGDAMLKALMGASFGVALTLVIFAGSELFTGNNMIMTIGSLNKKVSWLDTFKLWVVCYAGNLAGSLLVAYAFAQTGLVAKPATAGFVTAVVEAKMNAPFMALFVRGILCNILVCLAVWMAGRSKDDTAKILLIFWCLFAFIGSGFEHSIANMTLLAMGLFIDHGTSISWAGYMNNLIPVTLGNIVGGAGVIGVGYWYVANTKNSKTDTK